MVDADKTRHRFGDTHGLAGKPPAAIEEFAKRSFSKLHKSLDAVRGAAETASNIVKHGDTRFWHAPRFFRVRGLMVRASGRGICNGDPARFVAALRAPNPFVALDIPLFR